MEPDRNTWAQSALFQQQPDSSNEKAYIGKIEAVGSIAKHVAFERAVDGTKIGLKVKSAPKAWSILNHVRDFMQPLEKGGLSEQKTGHWT